MPDLPILPGGGIWGRINHYDATSRDGQRCSGCGSIKTPAFRGPMIEFEGHFDICVNCAKDLGRQAGLIEPGDYDKVVEENVIAKDAIIALQDRLDTAEMFIAEYFAPDDIEEEVE